LKAKPFLLALLICLAGCGLSSSPTTTVKEFIASSEKGDVDAMMSLFSSKGIQDTGVNKLKSDCQNFATMLKGIISGGGKLTMNEIKEDVKGQTARVTFVYRNEKANDSMGMGFDLSQENGKWRIDKVGERKPEDLGVTGTSTPSGAQSPISPPPPPPLLPTPAKGTISGGVLNNKAISLPKPPYPPMAKQAHTTGEVVVEVVVDESGKVISANATTGHPLLRAAAVAAAYGAKFPPTKDAGKPVKVIGVITYNFEIR
jgi:TonB family protein